MGAGVHFRLQDPRRALLFPGGPGDAGPSLSTPSLQLGPHSGPSPPFSRVCSPEPLGLTPITPALCLAHLNSPPRGMRLMGMGWGWGRPRCRGGSLVHSLSSHPISSPQYEERGDNKQGPGPPRILAVLDVPEVPPSPSPRPLLPTPQAVVQGGLRNFQLSHDRCRRVPVFSWDAMVSALE